MNAENLVIGAPYALASPAEKARILRFYAQALLRETPLHRIDQLSRPDLLD
jgi:hypothetical protein